MDFRPVMGLDAADDFDFDAGVLCLDYANTASWHASVHPDEKLNSYADLLRWAYASGTLEVETVGVLLEQSAHAPAEAARCLERAIQLREAIYRIFEALTNNQAVDPTNLELFNGFLQQTLSHGRIEMNGQENVWGWEEQPRALDRPLWPVVRSAADLLTSEQLHRVGQCQDDRGCGWLFLDTSRNRTRRWCSMESCGNRAKAQRHYGRVKKD